MTVSELCTNPYFWEGVLFQMNKIDDPEYQAGSEEKQLFDKGMKYAQTPINC